VPRDGHTSVDLVWVWARVTGRGFVVDRLILINSRVRDSLVSEPNLTVGKTLQVGVRIRISSLEKNYL